MYGFSSIQREEFDEVILCAKNLKTLKCLPKILFNIDIMDLYLLP